MYEIYWNSHRKMFSVRHKGKVVGHAHSINIPNAKFVVQPAGQRRVRETGQKNIHAFVKGDEFELLEHGAPPVMFLKHRVHYDPKVNDTFVTERGPIHWADMVSLRIRNNHPEILV